MRQTLLMMAGWILFAGAGAKGQTAEDLIAAAEAKEAKVDHLGAIADLDRAIALKPGLAVAHFLRAQSTIGAIYQKIAYGNSVGAVLAPKDSQVLFAEAMADFARAIALKPDYAEAFMARGDVRSSGVMRRFAREAGDDPLSWRDAIADYSSAIAANPNLAEAYYQRAMLRGGTATGDSEGARADLDKAIAANPNHVRALRSRAGYRSSAGDRLGAIADLDRAIAATPPSPGSSRAGDRASLLVNRGNMKLAIDDLAGALVDFEEAIALDPKNGSNYRYRGLIRQEKGDFVGAVADYATYKELQGEIPGGRPRVFVVDSSGKEREDVGRSDDLVHIYLYFALCRLQTGRATQELRLIRDEWRDGWPKTASLYLTGELGEEEFLAASAQGDVRTAAGQLISANYYIGMRRLISDRPAEARAFFERVVSSGAKGIDARLARAELARLPP